MQERQLPVFVRITEYKEILDIVDVMKQKLKESREGLERVKQLKAQEDQEIAEWEKSIADINKRLAYIDGAFFENE